MLSKDYKSREVSCLEETGLDSYIDMLKDRSRVVADADGEAKYKLFQRKIVNSGYAIRKIEDDAKKVPV